MNQPLTFDQILYNEPIHWLETQWSRKLNDHERNLVTQVYRWTRTNIEAEEIKFIKDTGCNCGKQQD